MTMDRHEMMANIKAKDTTPELLVRKALFKAGYRYRLHVRTLTGTPDIVLPKYKCAIFVHGCFWHGHDCKYFKVPKTNTEFWVGKISRNRERDNRSVKELQDAGWRVIVVWECSLKGTGNLDSILQDIITILEG